MQKIRIEQLNKRLAELGKFTENKTDFFENEIIDWISECTALFSEIGLDQVIIDNFLKFFSLNDKVEEDNERVRFPGQEKIYKNIKYFGPFKKEEYNNYYKLIGNFYYAKIAFSSAKNILQRKQDEERLVPQFLIDSLSDSNKYSHIISSLELIEQAYQNKNSDGLIKNSLTLLDSILNLNNILKQKGNLSKKIKILTSNNITRENFGVNKEFIFALDNNRLIRNQKSVHKDLPINYNIPFLVALSSAYLVIIFLEITMSTGKIIK